MALLLGGGDGEGDGDDDDSSYSNYVACDVGQVIESFHCCQTYQITRKEAKAMQWRIHSRSYGKSYKDSKLGTCIKKKKMSLELDVVKWVHLRS